LRDGVADYQHTVILHEQDVLVSDHTRQPLAFVKSIRGAGVGVVIGDVAVEVGRSLIRRQQAVVLQHVERKRPGLMRVQHYAYTGDAVDRRVDALR
jgi:hypothetical protein